MSGTDIAYAARSFWYGGWELISGSLSPYADARRCPVLTQASLVLRDDRQFGTLWMLLLVAFGVLLRVVNGPGLSPYGPLRRVRYCHGVSYYTVSRTYAATGAACRTAHCSVLTSTPFHYQRRCRPTALRGQSWMLSAGKPAGRDADGQCDSGKLLASARVAAHSNQYCVAAYHARVAPYCAQYCTAPYRPRVAAYRVQ
eukprot:3305577-Rhodomonas_salina.3